MELKDIEAIIHDISPYLAGLGVKELLLFGSRARGTALPDSDVDFLLIFKPGMKSFDAFMDAADAIEACFSCHVDILTPEAFNGVRLARILKEAKCYEIAA